MQIKDIVAGKKYINKSGEEKTNWTTVGHIFIKDDGAMSVKFNGYINPLAFANEKGEVWFNVFEQKKDKQFNTSNNSSFNSPQVGSVNSVSEEGRRYAEKYRREAEARKAMEEAPDENFFKNNAGNIPF